MGNKGGSIRFTEEETNRALEVMEAKLPTVADEWELVREEYMKKLTAMARQDSKINVVERDHKSLKGLYVRCRKKNPPTGK